MKYGQVQTSRVYYTIGDISEKLRIPEHQLRYWETRFPMLRPRKNRSGIRYYRTRDIELLKRIQEMLGVRKFSYAETLQYLTQPSSQARIPGKKRPDLKKLLDLRREVQLTLAMLREKSGLK